MLHYRFSSGDEQSVVIIRLWRVCSTKLGPVGVHGTVGWGDGSTSWKVRVCMEFRSPDGETTVGDIKKARFSTARGDFPQKQRNYPQWLCQMWVRLVGSRVEALLDIEQVAAHGRIGDHVLPGNCVPASRIEAEHFDPVIPVGASGITFNLQ